MMLNVLNFVLAAVTLNDCRKWQSKESLLEVVKLLCTFLEFLVQVTSFITRH